MSPVPGLCEYPIAGARVSVTDDRVVRVSVDAGPRPVSEWAVIAGLGADLPWFPAVQAFQRVLDLFPDLPAAPLLQVVAMGQTARVALAESVEEGDPRLALLAFDPRLLVREGALNRLRDTGWERAVLIHRAATPDLAPGEAATLIDNPHTPDEALVALAAHPDEEVRELLAARDRLPVQAMFVLALNPEGEAAQEVAERQDLPDTLAGYLATVRSTLVRGTIARRPTCPPGILANLVVDPDPMTRIEALHTIKRYHAPTEDFDADSATKPQRPIGGAEWADAVPRGSRRTWDPWAR